MKRSEKFEKLVSRIYRLLVEDNAAVTWNDKIPDPDNPSQYRQIDISIKRDDSLIHVECRTHKDPQDVKWIEELIGRKISLNADLVVAASDSGYTEGAKRKANKYGIILRDLRTLSDREVLEWGRKSKVTLTYYRFLNIGLRLLFKDHSEVNLSDAAKALSDKPEYINALFNSVKYHLNEQKDFNYPLCIFLEPEANNMDLCGKNLEGIKIRAEVYTYTEDLSIPSVSVYGSGAETLSFVEQSEEYDLELIKANQSVSVMLDLSKLPQAPGNSVLAGIIQWNFGQSVSLKIEDISLSGTQEQNIYLAGAEVGLQEFGT